MSQKNMKLGNRFLLIFFLTIINPIYADDKISTSQLLNLDDLIPSYEETDIKNTDPSNNIQVLKKKNKKGKFSDSYHAVLIGLDKITAKSSEIVIDINKTKKFGPLEIKILKCGKIKKNNILDNVAYMQVKDLTKTENEKVFIFNGWTFSSDPNLTPFDHAIYDLQLVDCYKT